MRHLILALIAVALGGPTHAFVGKVTVGPTRARLTQLTKLVLLAPDIQERLLLGDLEASERALRTVVCEAAWDRQFAVAKPA